jgi:predicted GNAT family acetyltransferase
VRDGRLRTRIGRVADLDGAVAAFNAPERAAGKTIIRVRACASAHAIDSGGTQIMTQSIDSTHFTFEYPDEAGYPDGVGTLTQDQTVLIGEMLADPRELGLDFTLVDDDAESTYEAIVGDTEVAAMPYTRAGDDRLVLLATSVFPEFRGQGVATELIRRVLDDVRRQHKTVTIMCPVVRTFIDRHPDYADLVDAQHPGVTRSRGHV